MSLVSIIIPCYNGEAYVGDAINGALEQTHCEVEVIVVDDGSTDNSLKVIQSFGDRIRCLSGPNRGACAARNWGFEESNGEFIQFFDADDLIHREKIQRQLAVLVGSDNTLVFSLHEVTSFDQTTSTNQWNRRDDPSDAIRFMFAGDLPTPAPLHRRSLVERIGGWREDLECAQDRDFHLRLAMSGVRFERVDDVLFTIRRRRGSIGMSSVSKIHTRRAELAIMAAENLISAGSWNSVRSHECAAMISNAARGLVLSSPSDAREWFRQAKKIHPSGGIAKVYSPIGLVLRRCFGSRITEFLHRKVRS
ncbi:glycosyltransferase family 2 protein [Verrucomicrobiales bacterium]|nr:glycosyltransferase family 2 protein [Verrucomicrobiales bacterium]